MGIICSERGRKNGGGAAPSLLYQKTDKDQKIDRYVRVCYSVSWRYSEAGGLATIKKTIREVTDDALDNNVEIIRCAFGTVAVELKLTRENCPTHPSFITISQLSELRIKGLKFFGLFAGDRQVGFVAVEKASDTIYYMEKLAVLPEYRHKGYGRELVRFVIDYVRNHGGKKLSIGIIDKQTVLKNWYKEMGFKEIAAKEFEHLPFTVCFLDMEIS